MKALVIWTICLVASYSWIVWEFNTNDTYSGKMATMLVSTSHEVTIDSERSTLEAAGTDLFSIEINTRVIKAHRELQELGSPIRYRVAETEISPRAIVRVTGASALVRVRSNENMKVISYYPAQTVNEVAALLGLCFLIIWAMGIVLWPKLARLK